VTRDLDSDLSQRNSRVARNTLEQEIGRFGEDHLSNYELDVKKRDRLLAHGRQDTAYALCNTIDLLNEMKALKKRFARFERACLAVLAAMAYGIWAPEGTLQYIWSTVFNVVLRLF
jgi:hypothetical protein